MAFGERPLLQTTGNNVMSSKEKRIQWMEHVEKADPERRSRPVTTYIFNNGERVFHKAKRSNGRTRKS